MIGVDIVKISRIERIYKRFGEKFLEKIFTIQEINDIKKITNYKRKVEKIAGRFAAKEAILKIFKKELTFNNIEILTDSYGAPFCKIADNHINISISHDGEYTVAVAQILSYK